MSGPIDPVTAALRVGSQLIDRLWPDQETKDRAKLELLRLQQEGELEQFRGVKELALGQIPVNLEEAKSDSLFKSGWRPAVGWVCVVGLFYQFLIYPIAVAFEPKITSLDLGTLLTLLFGILGLGALRTQEKLQGKT